nr:hypothetical protein [Lacrimispora amygdalina]
MFEKVMNSIKEFLENTPDDIYEFSILLEDALVDDYDEMYKQQPEAMKVLADEVPDICASAEPGMKKEEIEIFKEKLRKEYDRAKKCIRN